MLSIRTGLCGILASTEVKTGSPFLVSEVTLWLSCLGTEVKTGNFESILEFLEYDFDTSYFPRGRGRGREDPTRGEFCLKLYVKPINWSF